jgi:hypothetical protein
VRYTDPDGECINFVIGAIIGFVTSSATEIGDRMLSGQSLGEAINSTIHDPVALGSIAASTAIGAVTSGVSGIAVKAATKGATTLATAAIKSTAINTVAGAIDAAGKDVALKAITGKQQNLKETASAAIKGAISAGVSSGVTQAVIARGSMVASTSFSNEYGVEAGTSIVRPIWDGAVGVVGESVIPTALDVKRSLKTGPVVEK